MNPNYGYQLYQAQRVAPRAELLARDARLGRQAAAVSRGTGRVARAIRRRPAQRALGRLVSRAYRRRSPSWV
jgi:hypothetical protein